MFRKVLIGLAIVAFALMAGGVAVRDGAASPLARAAEEAFFGGNADVAFAQRLWRE